MTIPTQDIIRPTSMTLVRRDVLAGQPLAYKASERIKQFLEAVTIVASTKRDPDKFRLDVTMAQRHQSTAVFTDNPVPRGNSVTDHSIRRPDRAQFTGTITETPFGLRDSSLLPSISRVQDQLRLLYQLKDDREPLLMVTSVRTVDGMAITSLDVSKSQETGLAVDISISLKKILFVSEVRDDPIPDTLAAQVGYAPNEYASSSATVR